MDKAERIIIDGTEYVRADLAPPGSMGEKRIIVADRGWVFVGTCHDNSDGSVTITGARNIRRWGTTKGLGELATGPTSSTQSDDYGTVRCVPIVSIKVERGW